MALAHLLRRENCRLWFGRGVLRQSCAGFEPDWGRCRAWRKIVARHGTGTKKQSRYICSQGGNPLDDGARCIDRVEVDIKKCKRHSDPWWAGWPSYTSGRLPGQRDASAVQIIVTNPSTTFCREESYLRAKGVHFVPFPLFQCHWSTSTEQRLDRSGRGIAYTYLGRWSP